MECGPKWTDASEQREVERRNTENNERVHNYLYCRRGGGCLIISISSGGVFFQHPFDRMKVLDEHMLSTTHSGQVRLDHCDKGVALITLDDG